MPTRAVYVTDELWEKARKISGIEKPSPLVQTALKMLIQYWPKKVEEELSEAEANRILAEGFQRLAIAKIKRDVIASHDPDE